MPTRSGTPLRTPSKSANSFDVLGVDHLNSEEDQKSLKNLSPMMTRSKTRAKSKASRSQLAPSNASQPSPKLSSDPALKSKTSSLRQRTPAAPTHAKAATSTAGATTPTTASQPPVFWKKVQERVIFSLLMIAGFTFNLAMGPSYMILLVLVLETLVYREVTALFNVPGRTLLSPQSQNEAEEEEDRMSQRESSR